MRSSFVWTLKTRGVVSRCETAEEQFDPRDNGKPRRPCFPMLFHTSTGRQRSWLYLSSDAVGVVRTPSFARAGIPGTKPFVKTRAADLKPAASKSVASWVLARYSGHTSNIISSALKLVRVPMVKVSRRDVQSEAKRRKGEVSLFTQGQICGLSGSNWQQLGFGSLLSASG